MTETDSAYRYVKWTVALYFASWISAVIVPGLVPLLGVMFLFGLPVAGYYIATDKQQLSQHSNEVTERHWIITLTLTFLTIGFYPLYYLYARDGVDDDTDSSMESSVESFSKDVQDKPQPTPSTPEELAAAASGTIQSKQLTHTGGFLTQHLYDKPPIKIFEPAERPEFFFRNQTKGFRITKPGGREVTPHHVSFSDDEEGSRHLIVTNERLIYLIGRKKGDEIQYFDYEEIQNPSSKKPIFFDKLSFELDDGTQYSFAPQENQDEVGEAKEYIQEQILEAKIGGYKVADNCYQEGKDAERTGDYHLALEHAEVGLSELEDVEESVHLVSTIDQSEIFDLRKSLSEVKFTSLRQIGVKALADGKYTASKESPSAALPSIREALKNLNAAVDWAKQPNLRTHVKEVEDQWDTARELEFDLLSTLVENSLQRATDEADHGNYRNAVEHVRSANASLDQAVEHANEHDYETEPYQRFRKQLVENGSDWEQKMLVTRINSALNAEPAGYDDALEQLGSVLGQFSEVRLVDDHQLDFLKQEAREAYLSVSIQGTTYLLEEGERHLESEAYARATDAFDEAAEVAATAATRAKPWDDIETDELTAVASMVETRKAEVEVTRINERIGDGIAAFEDGSYESAYETFTAVGEETVEIQGEIADPDDADQLAHLQSVASDNARKAQRASLGIGTENPTMREPNQVATVALEQPDARHQSSGARIQATETIVSAVGSTIATEIPGAPDLEFAYDRLDRDESIGRGGNADVYCATVTVDGTTHTVALKEPRIQGTIGTQVVEEFTQEAETWAKLDDHDHIVGVIDWGSQPLPWIAMEHMDGGHVGDRAGEMPFDHALWTAIVTAEAVRHAHRRGVAHLDLKPENILFRSVTDGWDVPKVADWGLSKHLLEHSKSIEGLSPHYAAPEQFDDNYGSADDITDVCQLGSVYYELFTGRPPFEGQPARVMNKVLTEAPQPPSELADVPPELDEILLTAMAKEKVDRYESVLYLRDALQELYDDQYQQE